MPRVEDDLELAKTARLDELAADGRWDEAHVRQYFRHVDAVEVNQRTPEQLAGILTSHSELAEQRSGDQPVVRVWTPDPAVDGWEAPGGATVVEVVCTDRPFLVDSVQMEILRQGWTLRDLFHPQFDDRPTPESWIYAEIVPAPGHQPTDALTTALDEGLHRILADVAVVVDDWSAMKAKVLDASDEIASSMTPHTEEDRRSAAELLRWLSTSNFTLLGYHEYRLVRGEASRVYEPVPGTGLGLLRNDADAGQRFGANPPTTELPILVIVTKDNQISTVHRPTYLDYIGVRQFDEAGRVIGEKRFLGLFAASAYSESVSRIPVLRAKAAEIMRIIGYDPESHGGKMVLAVLNTYPRDELFQTRAKVLAPIVEKISHLRERRQVRMFIRRDPYGRYLSALVYFPRDRYTTDVRERMQHILVERLHAASIEHEARVGESVLARLHFIVRMPADRRLGSVDVAALEQELTDATRSWNDRLYQEVAQSPTAVRRDEVSDVFPEGYKEDFSPRQAMMDVDALDRLQGDDDMSMALYAPDSERDEADLRLKIFRTGEGMKLHHVLPHLTQLGVDVIDERPYGVSMPDGRRAWVLDFGLQVPGGAEAVADHWTPEARQRVIDAFTASVEGRSESDSLNVLVTQAGLGWREVSWLRAISRYLQQIGSTYSQAYIAGALAANKQIAVDLVRLFEARFDPDADATSEDGRHKASEEISQRISEALDDVASLDHDRILRLFWSVLQVIIRTNAFQPDRAALAFKMLPRELAEVPQPRPAFEIFVYSPRVEGVHLRFGSVARGGLRWSDRAEDFRTEILGLVKAQMVKNTVIVPVGAKGGFFCKHLPDPAADRNAWFAEGQACYRVFIFALLDVTDNIVDGGVVPPERVVRWDGDDPYLVVAADKGTATFSDLANAISTDRGFWLGDAFASGGSAGYDHKGMGITARGAWESVKRHFREMGVDCQSEDFTCVGVGDMSGDVFGNGMLLSEHTRLVAAFDHRHVFVDPTPDAAASFAERKRLFELPRSSWADYDASLISAGGGIFPRTAKSVTITEQMRAALGIEDGVARLTPAELIRAILQAPVDLFWNGGIGTYVKGADETNAHVGDKANDAVRIDGGQLRVRCVGEGGNLGLTQLGRIAYAERDGRINTDFIDNSAGVDTSDHEVNIKILLEPEVRAGRLSMDERNELLASMTDEVGQLVLAHNDDQNVALANANSLAAGMAQVHEEWMDWLVDEGFLDREIEFLPDSDEMAARIARGEGLTSPELAVLLSYTKIWLAEQILASDLPDDPYLAFRLTDYFPSKLRERYAEQMTQHRLRREIITTVAVNRFVNSSGITSAYRLTDETGAAPADVIRAQLAARSVFHAGRYELRLRKLDGVLDAAQQTDFRIEIRTLVERGTRWMIANRRAPIDVQAALDQFADAIDAIRDHLPDLLGANERTIFDRRVQRFLALGLDQDLARVRAGLPFLQVGLPIAQTAATSGRDLLEVARIHFLVSERLGLDTLLRRILALPRGDRWNDLARGALRDDLQAVVAQLTGEVLETDARTPEEAVDAWLAQAQRLDKARSTIDDICAGEPDLARLSVGIRTVRSLLKTTA